MAPGVELIGDIIAIHWPEDSKWYDALVVGYRNDETYIRKHNVYFF